MDVQEICEELCELSRIEQNRIKVISSIFINQTEWLKEYKINSFMNNLRNQIQFYGKSDTDYIKRIEDLKKQYFDLVDQIINEYNIRFISLLTEIQNAQNNQKIAMANIILQMNSGNILNVVACQNKRDNLEKIIKRCYGEMMKCTEEAMNKVNELFINKEGQLVKYKKNIFQKLVNFFTGRKKIENYVIKPTIQEIENLQNNVKEQAEAINE